MNRFTGAPALAVAAVAAAGVSAADATALQTGRQGGPVVSLGVSWMLSTPARLTDDDDQGAAALFGTEEFDDGQFEGGFEIVAALAYRTGMLRFQAEFGGANGRGFGGDRKFRGNTNYPEAGTEQPTAGRMSVNRLMVAVYLDLPGIGDTRALGPRRRPLFQPYLGVGGGLGWYYFFGYTQQFPDPDDPDGGLRRGPDDEIPYTAGPPGSGQSGAWMLSAGFVVPVIAGLSLDLSYRYTDMGSVGTDAGQINVVRYGEQGETLRAATRINPITGRYRPHAVAVLFRLGS